MDRSWGNTLRLVLHRGSQVGAHSPESLDHQGGLPFIHVAQGIGADAHHDLADHFQMAGGRWLQKYLMSPPVVRIRPAFHHAGTELESTVGHFRV